jgi:hypothetical protein
MKNPLSRQVGSEPFLRSSDKPQAVDRPAVRP